MSQFMLALHDDPSEFQKLSPEEIQRVIEEYGAWAARLGEQGKMESGNKLNRHTTLTAGPPQRERGPFTTGLFFWVRRLMWCVD